MDTNFRTDAGEEYENNTFPTEETLYEDKVSIPPLYTNIFISTLLVLVCVLILSGNSLVLCSVGRYPTLRIPTNMVLCALALSDITVGINMVCMLTLSFSGHSISAMTYIQCQLRIYFMILLPSLTTNFLICGK